MHASDRTNALLIVGPLPPPIGGSPVTVQAIVDELAQHPTVRTLVINTSPTRDPRKKMTGLNPEKVRRMALVMPRYWRKVGGSSAVLVFANNLFAATLVPLLLLAARWHRKPFYLKPVGGDLDLYLAAQKTPFRASLLHVLKAADGLLVQTRQLQAALQVMGCTNVHYLPGCRRLSATGRPQPRAADELRLVFLAHIVRDKGPLILLEALQRLAREGAARVSCDFYGPIHDESRDEFMRGLASTPRTRHCGVAEPGSGSDVIAGYDALVLPTYFACEGHPGVIIEAMHAGVPVISTRHRAIPELIDDGENGLLVPAHDSRALAAAIRRLALDRALVERLGRANYLRGNEFTAKAVVGRMLEIMFPRATVPLAAAVAPSATARPPQN